MQHGFVATYRGASYPANIGPGSGDVVLFASEEPPVDHGFEPGPGYWRRQVHADELTELAMLRPVGRYQDERCLVIGDRGDRLHIAYLGHDAIHAEELGYWMVDRGAYEVVVARSEVTDVVSERNPLPCGAESAAVPPAEPVQAPDLPEPDAESMPPDWFSGRPQGDPNAALRDELVAADEDLPSWDRTGSHAKRPAGDGQGADPQPALAALNGHRTNGRTAAYTNGFVEPGGTGTAAFDQQAADLGGPFDTAAGQPDAAPAPLQPAEPLQPPAQQPPAQSAPPGEPAAQPEPSAWSDARSGQLPVDPAAAGWQRPVPAEPQPMQPPAVQGDQPSPPPPAEWNARANGSLPNGMPGGGAADLPAPLDAWQPGEDTAAALPKRVKPDAEARPGERPAWPQSSGPAVPTFEPDPGQLGQPADAPLAAPPPADQAWPGTGVEPTGEPTDGFDAPSAAAPGVFPQAADPGWAGAALTPPQGQQAPAVPAWARDDTNPDPLPGSPIGTSPADPAGTQPSVPPEPPATGPMPGNPMLGNPMPGNPMPASNMPADPMPASPVPASPVAAEPPVVEPPAPEPIESTMMWTPDWSDDDPSAAPRIAPAAQPRQPAPAPAARPADADPGDLRPRTDAWAFDPQTGAVRAADAPAPRPAPGTDPTATFQRPAAPGSDPTATYQQPAALADPAAAAPMPPMPQAPAEFPPPGQTVHYGDRKVASVAPPAAMPANPPQRPAHAAGQVADPQSEAGKLSPRWTFQDLVARAGIPATEYAVGEIAEGAFCLVESGEGYDVCYVERGAQHDVQHFGNEQAAFYYLFGRVAAVALLSGRLPGRDG